MIVVFAIAGLVLGIAIALLTPTKARYQVMIVGASTLAAVAIQQTFFDQITVPAEQLTSLFTGRIAIIAAGATIGICFALTMAKKPIIQTAILALTVAYSVIVPMLWAA